MNQLLVDRIGKIASIHEVNFLFRAYGNIVNVDFRTGASYDSAIIEFEPGSRLADAIREKNNYMLSDDSRITVSYVNEVGGSGYRSRDRPTESRPSYSSRARSPPPRQTYDQGSSSNYIPFNEPATFSTNSWNDSRSQASSYDSRSRNDYQRSNRRRSQSPPPPRPNNNYQRGGGRDNRREPTSDFRQNSCQEVEDIDADTLVLPSAKPGTEPNLLHALNPPFGTPGTVGKKIKVFANSFKLWSIPSRDFYQYDITTKSVSKDPKAESTSSGKPTMRSITRRIFQQWTKETKIFGVTDGEKNLWTTEQLAIPDGGSEFLVELKELDDKNSKPVPGETDEKKNNTFVIKVRFAAIVSMDALHEYMQTGEGDPPQDCLNIVRLILAHRPGMLFTSFHKSTHWGFYDAYNPRFRLPEGFTLGHGWKLGVTPTLNELLMTVDLSFTAFYPAVNVIEAVALALNKNDVRSLYPNTVEFTRISKYLKGVGVKASHIRRNHRIHGLSKETATTATITLHEGGTCTVAEYFMNKYSIRLSRPDLPCVLCRGGKDLIPMELLTIREGQRHMGKLSDIQTSEVIKMAAKAPEDRKKQTLDGRFKMHKNDSRDDEFLQAWGIDIDSKMKVIDARVLEPPTVSGRGGEAIGFNYRDGSLDYQHARKFAFYRGVPLTTWGVAVFGQLRPRDKECLQGLLDEISTQCSRLGNPMARRNVDDVIVVNGGMSVETTLRKAVDKATSAASRDHGSTTDSRKVMIFCVMVGKSAMYDEIKYLTETNNPGRVDAITQCMREKQFSKAPHFLSGAGVNFALKINAKLGGANTVVDPNRFLGRLSDFGTTPTMIIGCDISHPPAGVYGGVSTCAIVGSIDRNFVEYRAVESVQAGRNQTILNLEWMIRNLFQQFMARNNVLPKRLVIFRSGVSDGQFQEVALTEINSIKNAMHHMGCSDCKMTLVIVSKRHSHRFVPTNDSDGDKKGNLKPGTVIDSGVTHPFGFDFFLYSHAGIQGTSRASHYQVLLDEEKFTSDEFQAITFNLCYTYASANKSVSVTPAVYYAGLAAEHARYHRPGGTGTSESGTAASGDGDEAAALAEYAPLSSKTKKAMYFV